jgi:YD repeat-containing protein
MTQRFPGPLFHPAACLGLALALLVILSGSGIATPRPLAPPPPPPPATLPVHSPRYFFTVDLDPRYQLVGKGELTEEASAQSNCYCFTYDADGRLLRIEYRRAGVPMPDPFYQAARIDFEYQPGVERRWYRDAKGQPVRNIDGIYGEELSLNGQGFPTDVTNLDANGARMGDSSGILHYVRTLDDKGRLITGRRIGIFGTAVKDDSGYFETRTVYDDQGRRSEYGNYDASGLLLNDDDGVALVRTTYTIDPDFIQSVESYFDAAGSTTEEKSSGVHQRQRKIDNRGFLLSESYFDTFGAPTLDTTTGIHERRYTYDDRGNQLTEEYFGTDDKPKNINSGYAKIVYKYDDRNRIGQWAFFGDDGSPQIVAALGAAVIRQEYNPDGEIARKQYFDGRGNPVDNLIYGAPAIRIRTEGDTTVVTLCDAHDKPKENANGGFVAFSYKTAVDSPLTRKNLYFDRHGRPLSAFRVYVINPHLHALRTTPSMQISARVGIAAAGLGSFLAAFLALRKSSHTRRRKVYVPSPLERFLGWFSIFAILEGTLRFVMTVYWWWVGYQNGRMGYGVYVLETLFILFFLYRLTRLRMTMRVLNITREEIDDLVRDFLNKSNLTPPWDESCKTFVTDSIWVRIKYALTKYHAYLAFRHVERRDLVRGLAQYIRANVGRLVGPPATRAISFYYPCVAVAYFLLGCTAFYTLYQLLKR